MTMLTRWNPYREMLTLQEQMNRLFARPFDSFNHSSLDRSGVDVDVLEKDDAYVVRASVPGIERDQLDITLEQNVLTIKGETGTVEEQEGELYHLRERRWGRFSRSIQLPARVDADAVDAKLENGVLMVTVPKTEESKPKRISITNGQRNGQNAIEGRVVE